MKRSETEKEGQEVHDVVGLAGRLDVAAVHVHGLVELVGPGLLGHADGVQVGVHHVGHARRDVLQV